MEDINKYIVDGYSDKQINQILLGEKDGLTNMHLLSPNLSDETFRMYRKYVKENDINKQLSNDLIEAINNGLNIKMFSEKINKDSNIKLAIEVAKEATDLFDEMYSENMNDEKRELVLKYKINEIREELLKYKQYPVKSLEQIAKYVNINGKIDFDISSNIYNNEQLGYIFDCAGNGKLNNEILNPAYTFEKMRLTNYFVNHNLNLLYIDKYSDEQANKLNEFLTENIDIKDIYNKNYNIKELEIIQDCMQSNKEPKYLLSQYKKYIGKDELKFKTIEFLYLNNVRKRDYNNFIKIQTDLQKENSLSHVMHIIENFKDCKKETDISPLLHLGYDYYQREIIKKGMYNHIDITKYCSPKFSSQKMEFLLSELTNHSVIDNACNSDYSIDDMKCIIFYNTKGIYYDTLKEYKEHYMEDSNKEFEIFVNYYHKYMSDYRHENNIILIEALVNYNRTHEYQINIDQILGERNQYYIFDHLFKDLDNGLDVNLFYNNKYDPAQKDELRKGLKEKLDITKYNDPKLSAEEMKKIRLSLKKEETLDELIDKYKEPSLEINDQDVKNVER